MKRLTSLLVIGIMTLLTAAGMPDTAVTEQEQADVILGDEQFEEYLPLLEGKRVALFSNHTGIVGDDDEHILDALVERDVNVVAVFSPEHGFRGTEDAGATVDDSVDEKTGVPILSLYENEDTHTPAKEDMDKFDVLVVDMQDVGLRYYTYYISMYYLMDACAAENKDMIILDRPNPNGFYVDGPILQDKYKSNVGQLPIPVVYGMTWGELAGMINGEGWLSSGKDACHLTVIPCRNYTHQTKTSLSRNPSPNIKDMRAVYLYASTCFFENTVISVGRGTDFPFEAYGSPYLKDVPGFDFSFTPKSMSGAQEPPFKDETCYGADLRVVPMEEIWENGINLDYLVDAYNAYKETSNGKTFWGPEYGHDVYWIDYLSGSDSLRKMIEEGKTAEEIKASWQADINAFKLKRKQYLLYEDTDVVQEPVHGIYVSAYVAGTPSMMDEIIGHIDETSINAVVIDVKNDEGNIVFDMDSELIDSLGVENILVKDMPALIKKLHEHDVYVIARCVAFRDPFIDEVKPEWMLKTKDGEIYEDNKGFNWMDPDNKEAREYLIEVAFGCEEAGFDEVQYDYVRFPAGITEEDLGYNGYHRRQAILGFVRDAHAPLKKDGIPLSLDVFGTVINSRIDRNIVGQEYSWLSMKCEYLSPMIYPSHYYEGTMGKDYPDLYPYETIDAAMKYSSAELATVNPKGDRQQASVRPWLQGFTASYLKNYRKYGAQEVRDQIKAVNDNGVDSWIIWNPSCKYTWEAFME